MCHMNWGSLRVEADPWNCGVRLNSIYGWACLSPNPPSASAMNPEEEHPPVYRGIDCPIEVLMYGIANRCVYQFVPRGVPTGVTSRPRPTCARQITRAPMGGPPDSGELAPGAPVFEIDGERFPSFLITPHLRGRCDLRALGVHDGRCNQRDGWPLAAARSRTPDIQLPLASTRWGSWWCVVGVLGFLVFCRRCGSRLLGLSDIAVWTLGNLWAMHLSALPGELEMSTRRRRDDGFTGCTGSSIDPAKYLPTRIAPNTCPLGSRSVRSRLRCASHLVTDACR